MTTMQVFNIKSQEEFNIAQKQIFMPVKDYDGKIKKWVKKKMMDYLYKNSPEMKRYLRIHHWAKRKLFQRGIKVFRRVFGKYMIRGDKEIPPEWYNNHIRIFYNSFTMGLKDTWKHMVWNMPGNRNPEWRNQFKNDPEIFFKKSILDANQWSFCNRRDLMGIWVTEILEDTFDREWINMTMMRMTHEMMDWYGVSEEERNKVPRPGQYPIYLSSNQNNPQYHLQHQNHPVIGKIWQPKEVVDNGNKSKSKKSTKKSKRAKVSRGKNKRSN